MEYVIKCTQEEKRQLQITQIVLYGYLNRYRERLKEVDGTIYEAMIKGRIKLHKRCLMI